MPAWLDAVLQRGLARRADDRFTTAAEFAAALRDAPAGRWADRPGKRNRPLVRVAGVAALFIVFATTWRLADVFRLRSDIAEQVAAALELRLQAADRAELAVGGTRDPEAYDFYLRGNEYFNRGSSSATLEAARDLYQRAVARDPRFALAWARLSLAHVHAFWTGTTARRHASPWPGRRPTRRSPSRQRCRKPISGWATTTIAATGTTSGRWNTDLLAGIGLVQGRQGRWDDAIVTLSEAARRDPRSNLRAFNFATSLSITRRFPEAERELARAITLAPDWGSPYAQQAQVYLAWWGDLAAARKVLARGVGLVGLGRFAHSLISNDQTVSSVFTSDTTSWPLLDQLTLQGFVGDTLRYYYLKAESARFRGQGSAEHAFADSLRILLEQRQRRRPDDPYPYSWLGIAYARLGRRADALAAGRRAVELMPVSRDALVGAYLQVTLARTYMLAGEPGLAVATLRPLLEIPSPITLAALRVNPIWDPLRSHAAFRSLTDPT